MTSGKRQPPFWLEMDFGEALARFAGADPKEMPVAPDKETAAPRTAAVRVKPGRKRLVQPPSKDAKPQ